MVVTVIPSSTRVLNHTHLLLSIYTNKYKYYLLKTHHLISLNLRDIAAPPQRAQKIFVLKRRLLGKKLVTPHKHERREVRVLTVSVSDHAQREFELIEHPNTQNPAGFIDSFHVVNNS